MTARMETATGRAPTHTCGGPIRVEIVPLGHGQTREWCAGCGVTGRVLPTMDAPVITDVHRAKWTYTFDQRRARHAALVPATWTRVAEIARWMGKDPRHVPQTLRASVRDGTIEMRHVPIDRPGGGRKTTTEYRRVL